MEQVVSVDGTPIAYQRSGVGPPLILVHGIASDHTRWTPLIEQVNEHFTVYAMDRRGRGGSSDDDEYSIKLEFEDIAALANSIDGPVNLYGHSSGALYALEGAPKIQNLRRLVLYEPAIANGKEVTPAHIVDRVQDMLDQDDPEEALATFMREVVQMSPQEIEQYRTLSSWPGRVTAAPTFPREMRTTNEYRFDAERFRDMQVPTLLLVGSESPPLFSTAVEKVHAALPNSRVRCLSGQGHSADNTAPELVANALMTFLLDE